MDDVTAGILVALIGIPILFIVLAVSTVLNGWALHLLWGWFFVPIFNLPVLSIGQSIGVAMVVSFLTYQPSKSEDGGTIAVMLVIRPFIAVLLGFIVKQFI